MRKMLSRKQTIDLVNEAIESGEIHADPSTEVKVGDINSESATAGKVIVADGDGGAEWGDIPNELPSITGNADKVLKVNSGATGVEWGSVSGGTQLYKHYVFANVVVEGETNPTKFLTAELITSDGNAMASFDDFANMAQGNYSGKISLNSSNKIIIWLSCTVRFYNETSYDIRNNYPFQTSPHCDISYQGVWTVRTYLKDTIAITDGTLVVTKSAVQYTSSNVTNFSDTVTAL